MKYEITLSPEAREDYDNLQPYKRAEVRDAIDGHLSYEPTRESKSRIKRLRGLEKPRYRLRVRDIRVFYDVEGENVEVLGIVEKRNADDWLAEKGVKS